MTEPTPPRRSETRSTSNLVRALGVVLALTVITVLLLQGHHTNAVRPIDPTSAINEARRVAPYDVLAPAGLSKGWRPTSARLATPTATRRKVPVHLHIGYVTPKEQYLALEESNAASAAFISTETDHGRKGNKVLIGGTEWRRYLSADGSTRSLVLDRHGATVVLTGTADEAELEEFAASLTG
jgi:uncharacterized protein DUF4245